METLTVEEVRKQGRQVVELIVPLLVEEEFRQFLDETPYLQQVRLQSRADGLAEGKAKGKIEGKAEGQREATVRNIQRTISIRFDVPLSQYADQLSQLDLATLEHLSEVALRVTSLAEFETVLDEITPNDTATNLNAPTPDCGH